MYCNAAAEELAELHPSDRLMVQLIQIPRLGPRIEGMLYKCTFDETISLLDDVSPRAFELYCCWRLSQGARKLSEAGQSLLHAKSFKELLSVRCFARELTVLTEAFQ